MIISRFINYAEKFKKLTPYLHRIAVIYFIFYTIKQHKEKREAKRAKRA